MILHLVRCPLISTIQMVLPWVLRNRNISCQAIRHSILWCFGWRVAIPFLLASIVFHQAWIKINFPENYHLFYSRLFTSAIVERSHSKIETGIFKIEKTKLVAIGVPQYVKELHKFDELHHRVDGMEEKFWGPFGSCRQSLVVSEIFDHIQVNGVVAPYFCRPSSEPGYLFRGALSWGHCESGQDIAACPTRPRSASRRGPRYFRTMTLWWRFPRRYVMNWLAG